MLKDVATGLQELHNQNAVHGNLVSGERLCFSRLCYMVKRRVSVCHLLSWIGDCENDQNVDMLERLVMLKDVATGLQELHKQDAVLGDLVSVCVVFTTRTDKQTRTAGRLTEYFCCRVLLQSAANVLVSSSNEVAGNNTLSYGDTFAAAAAAAVAPAATMSCLQSAANVLVSSSAAAPFGLVAKLGAAGISRAARQQQQQQQQRDSVSSLSYQSPGGFTLHWAAGATACIACSAPWCRCCISASTTCSNHVLIFSCAHRCSVLNFWLTAAVWSPQRCCSMVLWALHQTSTGESPCSSSSSSSIITAAAAAA
jgi:hypothetical protein